ncbi:HD domain-containing protein [Siphonobacter curvatus]|uniref:Phosphohydrolase n=1 Tax=Siphonobacter curvatus TaxID=2094562 RepID=A0A2S7ISV1_9BACT|nr:HD domain-containing protein [Siphonobacter curvatus]PQA60708.1 phosphohydrolase [Siphonobacter curvatus]
MKNFEMQATVDALLGLYQSFNEVVDERLLEHSIQTAQLAEEEGYDDEVVLAAFFHDIGQLLAAGHQYQAYGRIGSEYLRANGFSEKVTQVVVMHTEAERYLCWKFPERVRQLDEYRLQRLYAQGGIMLEREAKAYEKNPYFYLSLKVKEWDDEAPLRSRPVLDLEPYRRMALQHLQRQVG